MHDDLLNNRTKTAYNILTSNFSKIHAEFIEHSDMSTPSHNMQSK
ncbi:hypothetical protein XBJ2_80020 [Xenorhabdus bovienii str. Jollieti]|uniref:Uncharacterized protein n=1 Tax=Xenorhabdus bovienii (strain SS-2004) TaxID=406818 RepID=D3UYN3_XENBS|nr:hypothetical protein XBJ1_0260 [Xenorhabdus bovienii SS-2004]CDH30386.1 hypothetical protein XBJ2_80020 [Xenorhabdus bovienii str. Jollieti]